MDNKMKRPTFSIILPCYNSSKTIAQIIKCILKQHFQDFELIIINDGSTDDTFNIITEFGKLDNRIKIFNKVNEGVSVARNYGLKQAKGEWITFCDSDDTLSTEWLQIFKDCIKYDTDLIAQGYISSKENKPIIIPNKKFDNNEIIHWVSLAQQKFIWGFLWCKAFKRDIINKNEIYFNKNLKFQEDLEFILHYITHCDSIYNINRAEYTYVTYGILNKYQTSRRLESSRLCIRHLRNICQQDSEIVQLILYFQRLMIEDIFIGYHLKENSEQTRHNISVIKKVFKEGLKFSNCIGLRAKIFYFLFTYTNFYILNRIMKIITK